MPIRPTSSALALLVATAACAQSGATPVTSPAGAVDTVMVVDTVVTESGVNQDLEDQIARMQIELLARDVQIEELRGQLEGTRQELVRNMAKLQSQATRAEAASGLAEAEIASQALRRTPGGEALSELAEVESLIAESRTEFDGDNYAGALYLATQARSVARSGQGRLAAGSGSSLHEGELLFALPVPLQTVSRSNLRGGPGLGFDVLLTVDGGVPVTAQSHTAQWLRVTTSDGREGWIFHTLVSGRTP